MLINAKRARKVLQLAAVRERGTRRLLKEGRIHEPIRDGDKVSARRVHPLNGAAQLVQAAQSHKLAKINAAALNLEGIPALDREGRHHQLNGAASANCVAHFGVVRGRTRCKV